MFTIVFMTAAYLYYDFLYVYLFQHILGAKYSTKITVAGTLILWGAQFFTKILPFFIIGLQITSVANMLQLLFHLIHVLVLFDSSVGKRVLAIGLGLFVQAGMDMLGLNIASGLLGSYALMQTDSMFTVIGALISMVFITLGMIVLTKFWKMAEQIEWKISKFEWLCTLLPVSQIFFVWWAAVRYSINYQAVPVIVFAGIILGFLADIYMFTLFFRLNSKEKAEKELEGLKHQYELEQLRYEQLKKGQEETAKIRHDFQNYLLTLKQME